MGVARDIGDKLGVAHHCVFPLMCFTVNHEYVQVFTHRDKSLGRRSKFECSNGKTMVLKTGSDLVLLQVYQVHEAINVPNRSKLFVC